jgi:hypothetical protein
VDIQQLKDIPIGTRAIYGDEELLLNMGVKKI